MTEAEPTGAGTGPAAPRKGPAQGRTVRLACLVIALLGCTITVMPQVYGIGNPVGLILVGSGIATAGLAAFLYFSL